MYSNNNNTICYEGIQNIYRNSVVRRIRKVLTAKYPDDFMTRVKEPFKREWDSIKANAETLRQTGQFEAALVDELDILSVNHFWNLFDKYFDDIFSGVSDGVHKETKQAILGWAKNVKVVRDPLSHPAEHPITDSDAMTLLDSARKILEKFDPEGATRLMDLWQDVRTGGQNYSPLEASTLPSRESIAPRFVGRQTELKQLNDWLKDPDSRVWMLAGDGGKGKTAIAYEFAVAIRDAPPPELAVVIWMSAKARRFESGQPVNIESPDFWNLDSALDRVLLAYGVADLEQKNTQEKIEECIYWLSELPALIILDDVDSLEEQNEDAMNFFLYRTHVTPSKFLLTSRRVPFGWAPMVTQVSGLERDDGFRFIDSRMKMFDLDPAQFNRAVQGRILQACDGSPLFVQDLLRLCSVGESADRATKLWQNREGEAARRYALQREFDMLSNSAKKVLLACALFPEPISLPEIEIVAETPEYECRSAIQELQQLFLIPKPRFVDEVPRFGLNVNTRQLVTDVQGKTDLAKRISSSIKVITGKSETTPLIRGRIGQVIRQAVSLVKLNQHPEAEETLSRALTSYHSNADLHGSLGWVYKSWAPMPRYADARSQFSRAADLQSNSEDMYRHWSNMEMENHEWTAAANAAERGIGVVLPQSMQLAFNAGLARSRLAQDLYQQAQYARAEQEADKAKAHLEKALVNLEELETRQYQLHSRVHRATVINCEYLVRISEARQEPHRANHFLRLLANYLARWETEHPDDPNVDSETQRLLYRFPGLRGL